MEENNTNLENEQNNYKENHCFENHCWKKCIAMTLAAFLGGFLAVYFVTDQMMERMHRHHIKHKLYEKRILNDIESMYRDDMKAFENSFGIQKKFKKLKHSDMPMPVFFLDPVKIKTEFDDNTFKIIVGLKSLESDENKVKYDINGRKITIFGSSDVKDKNYEQNIAFSQDIILPENADTDNISKTKENNKLIISVPLKN